MLIQVFFLLIDVGLVTLKGEWWRCIYVLVIMYLEVMYRVRYPLNFEFIFSSHVLFSLEGL